MKLTFKRREVTSLQHLATLVADNADAMEPGLQILASNLNLGRTSVELAAIDGEHVPVLFILGLTADDAMLVRALEAYAWCLEYPESVQRLVPATLEPGWPPRIVFVAERLLESFVRKMRLLSFSAVDCFEFRYVEANGTTGFYLNRVDWAPASPGSETVAPRPARVEQPIVEEAVVPREEPRVVPREEPKLVLLREEPREELREEPKVAPREEPKIVPLVPVEEPRIVMLHEPKAAPRIVEPAATNGALSRDASERAERPPVVLKGLRPPTEPPPRGRSREVPDVLPGPVEGKPTAPREVVKPPAPPAPARSDVPKNGASKNDLTRSDAPQGDLAPTWRKFLDRLTSTFDTRPASAPAAPRASVPPATPPPAPAPAPLEILPFAADIEVTANEVAPDEATDESHDAIGDLTEKQRRILQGLTLPDNGELAPQWRKFLDHPALDETKIGVVRGYLQREFPLCTVYDFYDFQRNAQVFQLQDNLGKVTQLITMTAEFFDIHRDLEIRAWIEKHRLAQAMRQAGQAGVLVSQAGLQIERR
ncbi:MAG TPA: hypothetical protein VET45_10330 [Candidatus Binatia bacterium]|nr:hypothetical protein [Candidatus Binatia bacterium]